MKINIKHVSSTFNYGSCMMAVTLIKKLDSSIQNLEFYVDAYTEEDLIRLKYETGVERIYRYGIINSDNFLKKCINKIKKLVTKILLYNIKNVIIIGGDDISEYYGKEVLEKELKKISKESKNKNIILLGQTMGPFTNYRAELARRSLVNTKIYTRDDKCLDYLKNINFENVEKGRDLAFSNLPMQYKAKDILKKYNIVKGEYVTIVLSGLYQCYTKKLSDYINQQVHIVKKILGNKKLRDKKIVFLPHVLKPQHVDDRLIIKEVMERLNNDERVRSVAIYDQMFPSEAREILGNGLFTVTGRMHAAVSTFYMKKPAVSLSYSVKYAGVIGDGLDMNDLVIECSESELWSEGKIVMLVEEKINYVLNNYDRLIEKINLNVDKTNRLVEKELEDVVMQIKKN